MVYPSLAVPFYVRVPKQWPARALHLSRRGQGGFTFLGVLILVAIIGLASAAQVVVGSLVERREKEAELLWIGGEFKRAIISYSTQTPAGRKPSPWLIRPDRELAAIRIPVPVASALGACQQEAAPKSKDPA